MENVPSPIHRKTSYVAALSTIGLFQRTRASLDVGSLRRLHKRNRELLE